MSDSPPDIAALSLADLRILVERLLEENAGLRAENARLRDALAEAKGLKGRPKLKPSGMEKKAAARRKAKQGREAGRAAPRGAKRLKVDEERVIATPHPEGSRFKGYEDYVVQDVIVEAHVVRYRRERWLTPDGRSLVAPLPAGGCAATSGPGSDALLSPCITRARPRATAWCRCWATWGSRSPSVRSCAS